MTRCEACRKPLPSLRGRRFHGRCRPSRQDVSPRKIDARIRAAYAEIQMRRKTA
jgi:hypothetical protein